MQHTLGHHSVLTTNRYTHLTTQPEALAAQRFDAPMSRNHRQVKCSAGAVGALLTHSPRLEFRYRDSGTGKNTLRTVSGAHFLWLVLQHVLPKGLRRSRNFGLLHPNCKHRQRLGLLRLTRSAPAATVRCPAGTPSSAPSFKPPTLRERHTLQCHCCASAMLTVRRRIATLAPQSGTAGPPGAVREGSIHRTGNPVEPPATNMPKGVVAGLVQKTAFCTQPPLQ